jgi:alpha-L-fucosidase 2
MRHSNICFLILLFLPVSNGLTTSTRAERISYEEPDMRLWFDKEATDRNDSLALGNGRLGAVLFHGVKNELFHISEETLWVNEPVSLAEGCRMREHIPRVWKLLDQDRFQEASELVEKYWFDKRPQLRVDLLANMTMTFPELQQSSEYRRELDMRTAVARLSFTSQGVHFVRET